MQYSANTCNDLKKQNEKLSEELELCKADQEFVWSLWKELQKQSPDLTAAMDLVIAREKHKNEERFGGMEANLVCKNREIETLKFLLDAKEKEIAEQIMRGNHIEAIIAQVKEAVEIEKFENVKKTEMLSKTTLECEVMKGKCGRLLEENKVLRDTERSLRSQLSQAVADGRDKHMLEEAYQRQVEKAQALEGDVSSLGDKMAVLSKECSRNVEKCQTLEHQLVECQKELEAARESASSKEASIMLLKKDIAKGQESCEREIGLHKNENLKLKSKITELESEITELKADLHVKDGRIQSQAEVIGELMSQRNDLRRDKTSMEQVSERTGEEEVTSYSDGAGKGTMRRGSRGGPMVRKRSKSEKRIRCLSSSTPVGCRKRCSGGTLLESTEKELFDVKMQLRLKDEEVLCLRKLHDQRQKRMRILLKEHRLVLKQLKTFMDQDECSNEKRSRPRQLNSPVGKAPSHPGHHGDSEAILGELNVCKSKCQELEKKILSLEEERDTLSAQCVRSRTKVVELQGLYQNAKEELEKTAMNLEVQSRNQMLERKVAELMRGRDSLDRQVAQLQQLNSLTTSQLGEEKRALEGRVVQLEGEKAALGTTMSELEYERRGLKREVARLQEDKSSLEVVLFQEREAHQREVSLVQQEKTRLDGMVSQLRHDKGRVEVKLSQLQHEKGILTARCNTYKEQCIKTGEEVAQLQSTVSKLMRGQNAITASLPHITTPSLSGSHPNSPHDPAAVLSTESLHDRNITDSSTDHVTEVPGGGEQDVQHVTSLTISSLSTSSLQLTPAADGGGGAAMSSSGLNQPYMYISSENSRHHRARSDGDVMLGRHPSVHTHPTDASDEEATPTKTHPGATPSSRVSVAAGARGRGGVKDGYHKRQLTGQQVRSLHYRLKALTDHVAALSAVKQSLSQALDAERVSSEKSKVEIRDLTQKLRATKAALQSAQGELRIVTDAKAELEQKCSDLLSQRSNEVPGRTASEWKLMEEEKKHLQEKCSSLLEASKKLEGELQKSKEEVELAQNRSVKLDRDVKQKKQLITDLRSKVAQGKEDASRDQLKMQSLANEVLSLTNSLSKCKQQLALLRSQQKLQVDENEKLAQALKECQHDVTRTLNQLNACQEEHEKKEQLLAQMEASFKKKADAYFEMESKLILREKAIQHDFQAFTKTLADELCKESKHRTSEKRKSDKAPPGADVSEGIQVSARARDIACAFLNFSDVELDEFLSEVNVNDRSPVVCSESEKLLKFREAVRKFHYESPITAEMVQIFLQFVKENI